jgi:hypothetical protein
MLNMPTSSAAKDSLEAEKRTIPPTKDKAAHTVKTIKKT